MPSDGKQFTKEEASEEVRFPPGIPRPHAIDEFKRSLESKLATDDLTDIALKRVPAGKFDSLWPEAALQDPAPLPAKASWSDNDRYRRALVEVESRKRTNARIKAQRTEWYSKGNDEYFHVIADSMRETNPTLRTTLRDEYYLSDGRYDGCAAAEHVEKWVKKELDKSPQFDFYDNILNGIVAKRLPEGCPARVFTKLTRRVLHSINPYIRAPYTGAALGRFIIEKLMPDYKEPAEGLIERLTDKGMLDDIEEVQSECIPRRVRTPASSLGASTATGTRVARLPATTSTWQTRASTLGRGVSTASRCLLPRQS